MAKIRYSVSSKKSNISGGIFSKKIGFTIPSTWTVRSAMPSGKFWKTISYVNGRFFAFGYYNSTTGATSTDGITWSSITMPSNLVWQNVAYGNGTYVSMGADGGTSTQCATSTDGITWTGRTIPAKYWNYLLFAGGVFVATTKNNGGQYSSPDGITWTQISTSGNHYGMIRLFEQGKYVSLFLSPMTTNLISVSTSAGYLGSYSTLQSASINWAGLAYGNGTFMARGSKGANVLSSDATTWTAGNLPTTTGNFTGLTFGDGVFVATDSTSKVYTSTDGITWALGTISFGSNDYLSGAGYGNGNFVLLTNNWGTYASSKIYTSL